MMMPCLWHFIWWYCFLIFWYYLSNSSFGALFRFKKILSLFKYISLVWRKGRYLCLYWTKSGTSEMVSVLIIIYFISFVAIYISQNISTTFVWQWYGNVTKKGGLKFVMSEIIDLTKNKSKAKNRNCYTIQLMNNQPNTRTRTIGRYVYRSGIDQYWTRTCIFNSETDQDLGHGFMTVTLLSFSLFTASFVLVRIAYLVLLVLPKGNLNCY